MENSFYVSKPETRYWVYSNEIIVEFGGTLLVYPDFYGNNS